MMKDQTKLLATDKSFGCEHYENILNRSSVLKFFIAKVTAAIQMVIIWLQMSHACFTGVKQINIS